MPAIAEAASQARLLARRGADAAAVVLGASFHPFRTVRDGAHLVQGLMGQRDAAGPAAPEAPTSVEPDTSGTPKAAQSAATKTTPGKADPTKAAPRKPSPKKAAPPKAAPKKTAATKTAATKTAPGRATVAKEPAPPAPGPAAAEAVDVPVEPTGPAPHIPPSIAGEVERDYGDELPGIKSWED